MPLFEMTSEDLVAVPSSTFEAERVLERADLQRLLRQRIDAVADDVLIVSEEFGAFADARRRIDLLGVDHEGHLVVFELKRTADGGHLDLQALRYAAMISTMTFDDLAQHYEQYLQRVEPDAADEAHSRLAAWLDDGDHAVLSRLVRIVLVSAGFGREITTTVLWLNELYGLDIRCIRLAPYNVGGRLLLDVQQVIPLPEASELTIQLQRKASQERTVRRADGRDWTRYVIITASQTSEPLRKRRAILAMVRALAEAGVPAHRIADTIPGSRFLPVDGILDGEDLTQTFLRAYPKAGDRWFLESPIHEQNRTWVLTRMWATDTEPVLESLAQLAPPGSGIRFEAVP